MRVQFKLACDDWTGVQPYSAHWVTRKTLEIMLFVRWALWL